MKQSKTCLLKLERLIVGHVIRQNYNGKIVNCGISEGQIRAYECCKLSQLMGRVETVCDRSRTVHRVTRPPTQRNKGKRNIT